MGIEVSLAARRMALAVCVIAIAVAVRAADSGYVYSLMVTIGALALASTGMVLMFGLAHQLVLGQAAFCIVGAYGSGLLTLRLGLDPLSAAAASAAISMLFALLIGGPLLRMRGFVLAMASIAVQLILVHLATEALELTGGSMGLTGIKPFSLLGYAIESQAGMAILVWAVVGIAVVMCRNVTRSEVGLSLLAIASTEAGAASVGIDIARQKLRMFVLSAAMASVAGSLTAHALRIAEPQIFNLQYGFAMLTSVIVGGLLSPLGGVIGAFLTTGLREAMRELSMPLLETLMMGVITVAALIFLPYGLAGALDRMLRPRSRTVKAAVPPGGDAMPAPVHAATTPIGGQVLQVRGVSMSFGSLKAVNDVSFDVPAGSITALIGPNGAGKTTTFNIISGLAQPSAGRVLYRGQEIQDKSVDEIARLGVARTFQVIQLFDNLSVLDNVASGRHRFAKSTLTSVMAGLPSARREQAASRVAALGWLRFVGLEAEAAAPPRTLPFGSQRLVELARALALEPDLLIMDEPASGLNDSETERLAQLIVQIRARGTTVLLVEHDLRLVMGLADHVVVMDRGEKLEEGTPEHVRGSRAVVDAYLVGEAA